MGQDREKEARGRKSYLSVESLCADGVISRKRKRSKRVPVNWFPQMHCKWTAVSAVLKYDYELLSTGTSYAMKGITSSLLNTRQTWRDEGKHKEIRRKRGREREIYRGGGRRDGESEDMLEIIKDAWGKCYQAEGFCAKSNCFTTEMGETNVNSHWCFPEKGIKQTNKQQQQQQKDKKLK